MKILILCPDFPLPLTSGLKIRCFQILKGLAKQHEVTLVSLVHHESELQYVEEIKNICHQVYPVKVKFNKYFSAFKMLYSFQPWEVIAFYSKEMKLKVRELIKSNYFDLIWVNCLSLAQYIDCNRSSKSICILDSHNADELVWRKYARSSENFAMKIFASLNFRKIMRYQNKVINNFNAIVCVSKEDSNFMKSRILNNIPIWLIPNGVDTEYFVPDNENKNKNNVIMLCASMDITMNIDAALRFARDSFTIIKNKIPDSEFWIVGRNPSPEIMRLAKDGCIKVTGTVNDVRPFYRKAKIVVAPYRFGGGTKLKILEAMAMNIPIVSTTVGCQGIDTSSISQIIVKDNMKEFAEAVIKVLKPDSLQRDISRDSAREFIEERYSWNKIATTLKTRLSEVIR